MESETDNERIAKFMGFTEHEAHNLHSVVYSHPDLMGVYGDKAQKFKYDTSWDWLMPVLDKIADVGIKSMIQGVAAKAVVVCNAPVCQRIETHYARAVGFIKWYNEQPKPS